MSEVPPTAEKDAGPGGYCPTCRESFGTHANPPYAVIHRDGEHLHPLTRTRVIPPGVDQSR